jgi:hypothetical protein
VFREGINRSVGDCVIKMVGVVHVGGIGGPQPPSPYSQGQTMCYSRGLH